MNKSLTCLLVGCLLLLAGCDEELEIEYGRRASRSVNGTGVLADMFQQARYTVLTRRNMGPELSRTADVIVWFPDDFSPPTVKHQQWLQQWLTEKGGRTLIIVGREYDCEPDYWTEVQSRGLSANAASVAAYLAAANQRVTIELQARPLPYRSDWYEATKLKLPANVTTGTPTATIGPTTVASLSPKLTTLSGPWAKGINFQQTNLSLYSQLALTDTQGTRLLLAAGDGTAVYPLVYAQDLNSQQFSNFGQVQSQRLIVSNGSFLLNYALVNPQHRQLAANLIGETQVVSSSGNVVFLESGEGGPKIFTDDILDNFPTAWDLFKVEPLGKFLCHLAVLGILFCFMRWPIFGRPRLGTQISLLDFGQHLSALGRLLQRGGDRQYARQRLQQYQAQSHEHKPWITGSKS